LFFSARWSPNGQFLALAVRGSGYVIDAQTGSVVSQLSSESQEELSKMEIIDVEWSNDSKQIATYSSLGFISIYDSSDSEAFQVIDLNNGSRPQGFYDLFDWSPDNSYFAAYSYPSDAVGVWDTSGNQIADGDSCYVGAQTSLRFVESILWANDNITLMTSGFGLSFCRLENEELIQTSDTISYSELQGDVSIIHGIFHASWSPDDRWIVATMGVGISDPDNEFSCQLRVFDTLNSLAVARIDRGMCPITSWSPDGRFLAGSSGPLWLGELTQQ
jgi:WD40 repeat protein